jgi:tight adherence protein B
MPDLPPIFFFAIFVVLFALLALIISVWARQLEVRRKKKIARILDTADAHQQVQIAPETALLLEGIKHGDQSLMAKLAALPFTRSLGDKIRQAGMSTAPETMLLIMAAAAVGGGIFGAVSPIPGLGAYAIPLFAALGGYAPYFYVSKKQAKRLRAFEEQFPEALDFISRSMRAGHAFSMSLEMLADESPKPLGEEFRAVYNEQNLGAPLDVALRNMARRMPILDVNFFVSSVLMQRETGGNLAEILGKLSYVIRERFRLRGQVRSASAHGRMTSTILSVMPMITLVLLNLIAPTYLSGFADDPMGRKFLMGGAAGQLIGYFLMKKIVDIRV